MGDLHRVYLIPGLFGFGQLAGYDYFEHVERALRVEFESRGHKVEFIQAPTPPTSSIRARAEVVGRIVARTAGSSGPLHFLAHSTGGLDARLLLTHGGQLQLDPALLKWQDRVVSLVTLNTPHYGTPLASYFTTVSGTRLLYALSLLTILSLRAGEPSLALFARVLAGLGGLDRVLGTDLLFTRATSSLLKAVSQERRGEITDYLSNVQTDQGAILQISPESMDIFAAAVPPPPHVRCGSVVTRAPRPATLRQAARIRSPFMAFTAALYTTLYQFTSEPHERYGYAKPNVADAEKLRRVFGEVPSEHDCDGIVPSLSMLWGELVAVIEADHLDTLGHFHDDDRPVLHTDWLTSGARITRARFRSMIGAIARFQLGEEAGLGSAPFWGVPPPPSAPPTIGKLNFMGRPSRR